MKFFNDLVGKPVMIRTYSAGVHYGTLAECASATDGFDVYLEDARRIYDWNGAFTLSELATVGSTRKDSRFSVTIPGIALRAIEVIPMTEVGYANLNSIPNHKIES